MPFKINADRRDAGAQWPLGVAVGDLDLQGLRIRVGHPMRRTVDRRSKPSAAAVRPGAAPGAAASMHRGRIVEAAAQRRTKQTDATAASVGTT
jgi:hypothetical protein